MNKKLLSIISAMALTTSTATALTSNAIAHSSKDFIWDDFIELDISGMDIYKDFDNVYMDCMESDEDGLAVIFEVKQRQSYITVNLPETADINEIKEKINSVNSNLSFEKFSPYPDYPWQIQAHDENDNQVDLSVSDVKELSQIFKDESYKFSYNSSYYYYERSHFDKYGMLAYWDTSLETIKNYIAENNLDYEIVITDGKEFEGDGVELFYLKVNEELTTDVEYFNLIKKIYIESGSFPYCWHPQRSYSTPNFTINNSYLNGDANKDDNLTLADSVAVLQSIANPDKYALSMEGEFNAEVDGEDGITVNDALIIRQWGLENTRG